MKQDTEAGEASKIEPRAVSITVDGVGQVSGLTQSAVSTYACYVLAHGAGAGMAHPFMADIANGLAERGVSSLHFQFPYMDKSGRRPDPPSIAQAAVRAAVVEASRLFPGLPLFAGGKSFGGRMTSQAEAELSLPEVCGLVFLGFPLHVPDRPSLERAQHLDEVRIPMLFLQGCQFAGKVTHQFAG